LARRSREEEAYACLPPDCGARAAGLWRSITVDTRWLVVLGVAILVVSTGFTLRARRALGTMWASSAVVKDNHALRTDGPYGITRHPIYTGLLGMLAGTAAIDGLGRWVTFFGLGVLLVGLKVRAEERLLLMTSTVSGYR
jgi:protein-S-isoprenylcysteine O-methyltransferase Ste14